MKSRGVFIVCVVYGLVLCVLGGLVAGFGHGTYTLIALAGAPFSFFGAPVCFIAALTQWMLLVMAGRKLSAPKAFYVAFLVLHYVSAALLLSLPSSVYADWSYIGKIPHSYRVLLLLAFCFYLFGQIFIWKYVMPPRRENT
jgi:hypothetical protein